MDKLEQTLQGQEEKLNNISNAVTTVLIPGLTEAKSTIATLTDRITVLEQQAQDAQSHVPENVKDELQRMDASMDNMLSALSEALGGGTPSEPINTEPVDTNPVDGTPPVPIEEPTTAEPLPPVEEQPTEPLPTEPAEGTEPNNQGGEG